MSNDTALKTNGMFNILAKSGMIVHAYNTRTLEDKDNMNSRPALDM